MCQVINHWRNELNNGIHPEDIINDDNIYHGNFESFIEAQNELFGNNHIIHSGLIPNPYAGDIRNAKIYLLMLNPGFNPNDYYSENYDQYYYNSLINNLHQENLDEDYPFLYLNPRFCHTGGGSYWIAKFKNIINNLIENLDINYIEVLKHISKNICVLELFPYHTRNFNNHLNIPSVNMIIQYLHENVLPNENKFVACLRREGIWNVNQNENVMILPHQLRQGAYITLNSEIGQWIYNLLFILWQNQNN